MADATPTPVLGVRQKRVLPSRPRRGGPGIGSCDADVMILDAQRRRFDNEPLIPADTPFLLTTDASLIESPSDPATFQLNSVATQRYFDRPEVIKAYREQRLIQTPEFSVLPEDASVGGRFRPRSSGEHDLTDTSDAAYEKRHRKYETFEKRQRLREKEKLKHEQYKLRERIEQLKAMDGYAFLGLPPSSFPVSPEEHEQTDASYSPGHVNGTAACSEGERRRQQMLEVASVLEERYRTLLPSDKKLADLKSASRQSSVHPNTPDPRPHEPPHSLPTPQSNGSIILKIKVPQLQLRDNAGHLQLLTGSPEPKSETLSHRSLSPAKPSSRTDSPQRLRKRPRTESDSPCSTPEHQAWYSHGRTPRSEQCILVQWAERHRSVPNARKTQRHVTAFGTKVPPEIEEIRDFELPPWIRHRLSSAKLDEGSGAGAEQST